MEENKVKSTNPKPTSADEKIDKILEQQKGMNNKENPRSKIPKPLIIASIITMVILVTLGVYFSINSKKANDQVACTMEAKICPDGSSVGRSGPMCEFAPCPSPSTSSQEKPSEEPQKQTTPTTIPLKTYQNKTYKYSFSYNSNLIYETSSTPSENVIETLYFNYKKPANEENNVFIASLSGLDLATEKSILTAEDETYSSKPTFTNKKINGINVTTAETTITQNSEVIYRLYVALIPIGSKTLRFISDIEDKATVDKVLATLQTN